MQPQRVPTSRAAPRRPSAADDGPRSWVRVGVGLGIGLLIAYALGRAILQAAEVLTLVLLALFLAVSLEPLVALLIRLRLRRGMATTVVLLGVAGLFGVFVALFVPPVSNEISALTKAIPVWLKELHDHHSALGRLEDRYHLIEKVQQQLSSGGLGSHLASGVLGAGQLLLGAMTGTFIVITLTIYFLVGLPKIKAFGLRLVAASRRPQTEELTDRTMVQVGRYMLGNVATSALAGAATFLWAWGYGVPYPALLGFLVAFMDLIPVVGSTVGGVVVSLTALAVSVPVAIATAVFYVVFRFAEDHLITPFTMRYAVNVHPVATIVAVLIGGTLLGLIGALVAVPVATAIGLILDEVVYPARDRA